MHRTVFLQNYNTSPSRLGWYLIDSGLWGLALLSVISCLVSFLLVRVSLGPWKSIGLLHAKCEVAL